MNMTDVAGMANDALASLIDSGWIFEESAPTEAPLPGALEWASEELAYWLYSFFSLSSPDDAVWFLSRADYDRQSEEAFSWDFIENLSLEAAVGNDETNEVNRFWSFHRPILLSVRDRYSYLAVRDDGAIVHGEEPDFEETTVVSSSIESFLGLLSRKPDRDRGPAGQLVFGHSPESANSPPSRSA